MIARRLPQPPLRLYASLPCVQRGPSRTREVKFSLQGLCLYTTLVRIQRGSHLKPEYLFCKVWKSNAFPTLVALIYRSPDVSLTSEIQLVKLLGSTTFTFSHTIFMGDWNADMLDPESSDSRFVRNFSMNYRCS